MTTDSRSQANHLDPETLGAYLEGRTAAAERASVETHLAQCQDCYELFTDSAEALADDSSHQTPGPVSGEAQDRADDRRDDQRQPSSRWWLGGLAAAAAVVLLTWVGMDFMRPPPRQTQEFAALVAALQNGRPAEGRLSGGLPYAPAPVAVRSGDPSRVVAPRLDTAAAAVEASVHDDTGADAQSALGVALLATGRLDAAIRSFESAAAAAPKVAAHHSDLAAAYLERGRVTSTSADLERALAASQRALQMEPRMPEALFNAAVALERLDRNEEAIRAWQAYLAADSSSEWAQEARRRHADLTRR